MGDRINKWLSNAGACSRREADRLVEAGSVTINGVTAELGSKVEEGDIVEIKGRRVNPVRKRVIIAFNKPAGVVCTTDRIREKDNIIDYINYPERIYPIGRLDKDSEGLILLTNDGSIVNGILKARYYHEKEYVVTLTRPYDEEFIEKMAAGVDLGDTVTRKCKVTPVSKVTFRIVLTQGINRQIRRMCEALGYRVKYLKRIRIMHIELGTLPVGQWRDLTHSEIRKLEKIFF
ncbi:MAG: pseudouridine synthase [Lachnospiraceae bacterium]|nr:pseudouridine synthase [Lachnospiraceae bacterium]